MCILASGKYAYTSEPFNIPVPEARESAPENTAFSRCYSGISSGTYSSIYGCELTYDYVLSVDDDDEIVSATFRVANYDDKGSGTLNAADLYFYAVALNPYDTTDKEYLANWLEESLPKASEGKQTVTVGDATFELYYAGINGFSASYWLDIAKAT